MNATAGALIARSGSASVARPVTPRPVAGRYQRLRLATRTLLLGVFFVTPWLSWQGRQAVLFDLPERQFHLFGLTLWPQDLHLLALVLIVAAFALFTFTNWLGRLFCGHACPHSVFFSLFTAIEQRLEQQRSTWRRVGKWGLWLALATVTAITVVGYFLPIRELITSWHALGGWPLFWLAFFTVATFGAGGLLREQVCLHMCPYARFQSVMFDADTLLIAYDTARGEPRGPRRRRGGAGDCVDCTLCVQVCPTGIDIRHGLQYECIGCGLCIDACNGVMDRLDRPRGLIGYRTERSMRGLAKPRLRPRLLGYGGALACTVLVLLTVFLGREVFELDVQRDRQTLFTEIRTDAGVKQENNYLLRVQNKRTEALDVRLSVQGLDDVEWIGPRAVTLAAGERRQLPVRLRAAPAAQRIRSITFQAHDGADGTLLVRRENSFFGNPAERR